VKGSLIYETIHRNRFGSEIPTEISSSRIDYHGHPAVICIIRDISERKRAEASIREREQRFRMTGELIPYGVWICDASGQFTYCSESFLALIGMKQEDCKNHAWMRQLSPEDAERTKNDWMQTVQTGGFWDYEYRIFDKTGQEHFILSRGSPIRDSSGKITSFVGIHLDITDRRQYENQLETSVREKEVIIKEVHHRVKNNMQVISGFLQLQTNYIKDPESAEKLEECQRRVRSMALVHEKLYQSKHLGFINVAEYIKSLTSELQESYVVQTEVKFEVDVENININLDTAIPCGLIINELLTNSLKYAFKGRSSGTLGISLHLSPDHRFTLKVSDNGTGLPKNFDLKSTATLGMQLVQVLVRQLGGEITITSQQGTTFTITFPEKF
ncbi:MAG: PAS domain S-box protein, partial [Methanoregula sp.]